MHYVLTTLGVSKVSRRQKQEDVTGTSATAAAIANWGPIMRPNNIWALQGYHECLIRLGRHDEARIIGPQLAIAAGNITYKDNLHISIYLQQLLPTLGVSKVSRRQKQEDVTVSIRIIYGLCRATMNV
jgi:hypothetical protein